MLEPPSPLALLTGAGMVLVGLLAVLGWRRRTQVAPAFFGLGALAWLVDVALRLAAGKLDVPLDRYLVAHASPPNVRLALEIYLGVLRGVFVVVSLWFFAKRTRVGAAKRSETVAYGIGFGAIEAVLLGAYSLFVVGVALDAWNQLPARSRFDASLLAGPVRIAFPILERIVALVGHLVTALLVVGAVQGRRVWLLLAVAFEVSAATLTTWCFDHFAARSEAGYVKLELAVLGYTAVWALVTAGLARPSKRP